MALHKGFDPSKQFKVVKGFHEGGRKYSEGDAYEPRTRIGKSKVLFRHFVAGRVKPVAEEAKQEPKKEPQYVAPTPQEKPVETADEESVKQEVSEEESFTKPAPKKRGRKKKSEDQDL